MEYFVNSTENVNLYSYFVNISSKQLSLNISIISACYVLNFYFHNLEVLAPQRPPAPPTEYFQFNLGGYDPDNLIAGSNAPTLQGYVGCMRGLKIGDHLFDLSLQATNESKPGMQVTSPGPLSDDTLHNYLRHGYCTAGVRYVCSKYCEE
jgi:hypothetical protein